MRRPVLAVDVGGVLASKQHEGTPIEDAQEVLSVLADRYDLWIVSQCGIVRAENTKIWLDEMGFGELFPPDHRIFIGMKEPNKNRALKKINANMLVDDRLKHIIPASEILQRVIHFSAPNLYTFVIPRNYASASTWAEVGEILK